MTVNNDEKMIECLFQRFVQSWQSGKTNNLDEIVTTDCDIDFSIFDKGIRVEQFKKELAYRGLEPTYTRFEIYNYVCAIGENKAAQAGVVQGVFVDEKSEKKSNFTFNGFMVNSLIKTEEGWKFDALRFNLGSTSDNHARLYTSGVGVSYYESNTDFVKNWHMIDFVVGWHKNGRILSVVPEIDAPWYAIKNRKNKGTDEQQIKELLYRYCFALDYDCLELYEGVFSEDVKAKYEGYRLFDKRSVTEMLRFERQGMIGMGHIIYVDSIIFDGDIANVRAYRSGYLPSAKIFGEGKYKNYVNARYEFQVRKENKEWRILRLNYLPGSLENEITDEVFACSSEVL